MGIAEQKSNRIDMVLVVCEKYRYPESRNGAASTAAGQGVVYFDVREGHAPRAWARPCPRICYCYKVKDASCNKGDVLLQGCLLRRADNRLKGGRWQIGEECNLICQGRIRNN